MLILVKLKKGKESKGVKEGKKAKKNKEIFYKRSNWKE